MLQQDYLSVLEAKSNDELRDRIVSFGADLGFEQAAAMVVVERPSSAPLFMVMHNAPEAYLALAEDDARQRYDPVMQHCKQSSVPIIWSQDTYVRSGLGERWEEQAPFGYGNGIALALHMPLGRHFAFGVNRREPLPQSPAELTRLVADVQLFAVHVSEAATRLLPSTSELLNAPALTRREVECLRWTMEGKTAWEVASIVGISERTAVLHVSNATQKLGCVGKHQAVVKAMRLGLLQ